MAWAWIGVTPFFVFALMFLIVPTLYLVVGAFQDPAGNFTLANLAQLFTQSSIRSAYWISIKVSLASATFGGLLGFALAYAAVIGGLPQWIRPTLMTFSGVASNFAGLPLAFAFLAVCLLNTVGLLLAKFMRKSGEIGLRRALGANRGQVRVQFLTESIVLSVLGGTAGVLGGVLATAAYCAWQDWPLVVPGGSTAGGLTGALAIGVLAGVYPAIRAARLLPTEALTSV